MQIWSWLLVSIYSLSLTGVTGYVTCQSNYEDAFKKKETYYCKLNKSCCSIPSYPSECCILGCCPELNNPTDRGCCPNLHPNSTTPTETPISWWRYEEVLGVPLL
ncbi:hypothetical protein ACHWQZ_G007816 [Mnemiopsis leidyi]